MTLEGQYWHEHIFETTTLTTSGDHIDCMFNCELLSTSECDMFAVDGTNCYLGFTEGNAASVSPPSGPLEVYIKGGKG